MTNNSINTQVTLNSDGFSQAGGTTARTLTITGGNATISATGSNTYTMPSSSTTLIGQANVIFNEVVSGSGKTFILANTPVVGFVTVYAIGQELVPTNDYTISGGTITTVNTYSAGQVLANYITN